MRDERFPNEQGVAPRRGTEPHHSPRHVGDPSDVVTREAARTLGRSERTIQRAIANGELAATRVGSAYRIARAELARFAGVAPPSPPTPPPGPPATIVALPGLAESMASLPEPLSSFVGRDEELASVVALLEDPAVRVITITGPG